MEKPFILELQECKEEIAKLIEKYSGSIPATVLISIFNESIAILDDVATHQLEQAKQQYKEGLKDGEESVN